MLTRLSALEVRHLLALRAVIEEGSFTAAALRLGYSQPSVSGQIAGLERIVGAPLIERRTGRPAFLTPAGEAFYGSAIGALERLEAGGAAAAEAAWGIRQLRMGTFTSAGARFLPAILAVARAARPTVQIQLSVSPDLVRLEADVASGRTDAAFTIEPISHPELTSVPVADDPCVLLAPDAGARKLRGADALAAFPLILPAAPRLLRPLEARLRALGVVKEVLLHTDDDRVAQALVGAGAGAAILGALQVEHVVPRIARLGMHGVLPPRRLCLVWKTGCVRSEQAGELVLSALRRPLSAIPSAAAC